MSIVRNEASRLPRLLESLAPFRERGGEVVVLDTGSEDGTPEVARAAGCRVFVEARRFRGRLTALQASRLNAAFMKGGEGPFLRAGQPLFNFGDARAHAASLAQNRFQFAVDGGDTVDAIDVDALDAVVHSGAHSVGHFETRTQSPIGWHIGMREYFSDQRVMKWHGRSHQYLKPRPGAAPGAPMRLTRQQLLVSHHTDLDKPRDFQLAGMALDALAQPDFPRPSFYLSRALTVLGFHRSAMDLALSLDRSEVAASVRSAALCFAARCVAFIGRPPDESEALLFRAVLRDPTSRDPWLRLATRAMAQGDMQAAASLAQAALAVPARATLSEPEENLGEFPHAILYWSLLWLGRKEEARGHYERCLELDPGNATYRGHAGLFGGTSLKGASS
ncbi:MAG: glycosyltransferase [Vicinamibacteria bacterium]